MYGDSTQQTFAQRELMAKESPICAELSLLHA